MLLGLKYDFVDILFVPGHEAHPKTAKRSEGKKGWGTSAQNLMKSPSIKKCHVCVTVGNPSQNYFQTNDKNNCNE